ncbi:MAG: Phosphoglycolate phosphatase [Promethearchaeota archaeon]|nr:MAG: Phosphoglycolate phosphatase [Candidatus Lokiarchaeota archaeon]
MIKAIIFDFGFTLFYFTDASLEKYLHCYQKGLDKAIDVLKERGILKHKADSEIFKKKINSLRSKYFAESMKDHKEYPTLSIFKTIFDAMGINNIDKELLDLLTTIYHSYEAEEWQPFLKTKETLERLAKTSNIKLALLSNHPHHETIKRLIAKHKLSHYFDAIITSALFGKRKPHVEIFNYTIQQMGLKKQDKKHILMCGDEYADIMGAHRAGLQMVLYERKYKFPYEKEITLTDLKMIQEISEILNIIELEE